jgi:hypothetical protein
VYLFREPLAWSSTLGQIPASGCTLTLYGIPVTRYSLRGSVGVLEMGEDNTKDGGRRLSRNHLRPAGAARNPNWAMVHFGRRRIELPPAP